MGRYQYIADLAKQNINILGVECIPDTNELWVTFEFQWRDARTHYSKWSKTTLRVLGEQPDTDGLLVNAVYEEDIANAVIQATKEARAILEGVEYGNR